MNGSPLEKGSKLEELVTSISKLSRLLTSFRLYLTTILLQEQERVSSPKFLPSTSRWRSDCFFSILTDFFLSLCSYYDKL